MALSTTLPEQGVRDLLTTATALSSAGPAWLRSDFEPAHFRDVGGQPTAAYCKAMLVQMAAALGATADHRVRASLDEILAFIQHHVRSVRRRFKGTARRYIELGARSTGSGPPSLTLSVAPSTPAGWAEWWDRQATSGDNMFSTLTRGFRVNLPALLAHPAVPDDLKQQLLHGQDFVWVSDPPRSHLDNYRSCTDNAAVSGADIDRIVEAGFAEGPLEYRPYIVTPIGCIIKTEPRYKVRNAMDCTRSGVNPACARLSCELDDVAALVPRLRRGMLGCKWDIADAFHCWPLLCARCDLVGFKHPVTGEYYRYRYMCFGLSQAPPRPAALGPGHPGHRGGGGAAVLHPGYTFIGLHQPRPGRRLPG